MMEGSVPIDIGRETLVGFSESTRLPTQPHKNTVRGWCDVGVRHHVTGKYITLESVRIGKRRFTSLEAHERWLDKLNAGDDGWAT